MHKSINQIRIFVQYYFILQQRTLATCVLPPINNGNYGDNCSEGQTIDLGEVCIVVCDPNYQESVPSVECISAGNLDALPTCIGTFRYINKIVLVQFNSFNVHL